MMISTKKCNKCLEITIRLYNNIWCKNCYEKEYRIKNKDKIKKYNKEYRTKNKDKIKISKKTWFKENKDKIKECRKRNIENKNKYEKEYRTKNKDKINIRNSEYIKIKSKNDKNFYLKRMLRKRLTMAIKDNSKTGSAVKDLGCSIDELRQHLESKFQPGMSWDNHGINGWHIDHIIPLSSFNLQDPEEFKKACHYTNLQPLWAKDNMSKRDKI